MFSLLLDGSEIYEREREWGCLGAAYLRGGLGTEANRKVYDKAGGWV